MPVLCFCFSYTTSHVHIEVLISQDKQILLRQLCSVSELTLLLAWRTPSFFHGLNSQEVRQYDLLSLFFANLQLIVAELHPPVSDKPFSLINGQTLMTVIFFVLGFLMVQVWCWANEQIFPARPFTNYDLLPVLKAIQPRPLPKQVIESSRVK